MAFAKTFARYCMLGTRVKLLNDVLALLKSHTGPHIVWITGMAGTGKTSIALTLCRMLWLDESMFLGGSFFCSRSAGSVERTDVRRIIPTLATLLARQQPWFTSCLAKQISKTPDVAHWSVRTQIEQLIERPLAELALEKYYDGRIVFVIDALDECSNQSQLRELIDSIADFKSTLPIKFLLTSRPEMHIRTTSISDPVLSSIMSLHTMDPDQVAEDIRLYICTKLKQMFKTIPWCFDNDVEALVALSGGLFIFASTVLKYVFNRGNEAGRRERLQKATSAAVYSTVATKPLDQIYELVITEASQSDQVDTDELESMRKILACVLTARASLSVQALADLIGSNTDTLRGSLERLHSLVYLPGDDTEPDLRTLHASFGDYMLGRAAGHIRLAPSLGHDLLAEGCLRRMGWNDLRFNVSRSRSSYEPNAEFQPNSISLSLMYACLHWAHHIDAAFASSAFDEMVEGTFRRKFLFWLEVLSITRKMGIASGLLRIASSAVGEYFQLHARQLVTALQVKSQEVARFLRDANSFVVSSHAAIARSTPHIYLSAVPFASKDSLVFLDFAPLCAGAISVETFGTDHHASRLVMTLTGHEAAVTSIAYSSSGDLLAAGLENGTMHIWDTGTGEEVVSPMRSSDNFITSIAFAPDSQLLACGARNGAVSVWNVTTGRLCLRRPTSHSYAVNFLAFSPDGKLVASSSWSTVGLWNVETAQIVSAESYDESPISLSFSPDGTVLTLRCLESKRSWSIGAPGSKPQLLSHPDDGMYGRSPSPYSSKLSISLDNNSNLSVTGNGRVVTISDIHERDIDIRISPDETCFVAFGAYYDGLHLWEFRCIDADPMFTVLDGHWGSVRAISFSSDGKYLASELLNHTIRIWDVGRSQNAFQRVHESDVSALAVSPDNNIVVSGREDGSVHVHDVRTGEVRLDPLIGHEYQVKSAAISPDGQMIASGSMDDTVLLWLVQTGAPVGEPLSHENIVLAVSFSQDSRRIASGSDGGIVLVWDIATGKIMDFAPMRCESRVKSVTFSFNGQGLAAGDSQKRMYFWHLETGQLVHRFQLDDLRSIAFSPGASRLLASDKERDDLIHIVDVSAGEKLHSVHVASERNSDWSSVSWSPCNRYVAMMSWTDALYLWDLAHNTVSMIQGFASQMGFSSPKFASDGEFFVSGAPGGVLRFWDVKDTCSLALRAENDPVVRLTNAEIKDGWLVGPSGELLLWVPTNYHDHLQFASYPMTVLGQRRIVITVDDRGLNWGDDWHACWRGAVI